MSQHKFTVQIRKISGRKTRSLRKGGQCPGNIFGKKIDSLSVQFDTKSFIKLFSQIGESTLLYLQVTDEKDPRPVLVREVVKHPVTGSVLHVSFNQVDLKEKVNAPVPIELIGESPAETNHLGIMVQQLNEVEVEALPTDIPEKIELDITGLDQVGSQLLVSDIKVSKAVTLLTNLETLIVKIEPLAKEEVAPVVESPTEGETAPTEGEQPTPETPKTEAESEK